MNPETNAGKGIDSLVNKGAFLVANEEKLDAKNPSCLANCVIADALVVEDRSRVGVSEKPTEILFDWLGTLGPNDADFLDDGEIFWRRLDINVWDAGR